LPGLFGVVDLVREASESDPAHLLAIVARMSAAMQCEPFHSSVVISRPSLGACFGRIGFADCRRSVQPSLDTDVIAVTAGDVDEDHPQAPADADGLLGPGAACVASGYSTSGQAGLARLPGILSGFIADRGRGKCLLFADRYGRERLFLHRDGGRVFFASEAKAILAVAPRTRAFDTTGLAEMLACGCSLGTRSLFRDIEVLEGASELRFDHGGLERRRYFDRAEWEALEPAMPAEFVEGLSSSLSAAVNASIQAEPKVAVSLTGGLDSRMIMACLDAPEGSVPCYTFGSMYGITGDVATARRVAASCGQPHTVLELGRGFLDGLGKELEDAVRISDGYIGLSGAAELYLNRKARSVTGARMTGNWGGELMRGVRAFKYQLPKGDFLAPELVSAIHDSEASFSVSGNRVSSTLFHQMPFQGFGRYAIERSQLVVRSPFLADHVVKWLYRAPASDGESDMAAALIARRPELLAIPTDAGLLGKPPSRLRRGSRRALIKAEYLTSHGAPDWLARLSSSLPDSVLSTRFLGVDKFQHFRFWLPRELSGFVRETLLGSQHDVSEWFDMSKVKRIVNDHLAGRANYTDAIDKLLTVTLTKKTLFKDSAAIP
jgi:asparagine synthase (glutamine-hydrolysing)